MPLQQGFGGAEFGENFGFGHGGSGRRGGGWIDRVVTAPLQARFKP